LDTETVALDKLVLHPDNPRRSSVSDIADGLTRYGQYRPLVVQRSTSRILVGNHMWQAMVQLGWQQAAVHYVDLSDQDAKRLLLWDNRSSDKSAYDDDALAELLAELEPDLSGTGYDPDFLDDLIAAADAMPVLEPQPTSASYGETPEQTQARLDRFANAQPKAAFGVREAILVLPQEQFEELHGLIRAVKDASDAELTAGEAVLRGLRTAVRVIAKCSSGDDCDFCR